VTRRARLAPTVAVVAALALSSSACAEGEGVVSGSDAQLARDAVIRESDLPRAYETADAPDTDTPFVDPADGCAALATVDEPASDARATSDAYVAADTSRWLTSTVWVLETTEAAQAAIDTLRGLESVDCFSAFFDAAFVESTARQNPRPFLVLDTITATDVETGDGGVRVEGVGRFTAGEVQSSLTVAFTTVRVGRSLAMLHTIVGGDPDPAGDGELLDAMVARLVED
jgi:hypothetical protein